MSYWETQRQIELGRLADDAGAFARQWKANRDQKALDVKVRAAYVQALEMAKKTGDMPVEFQAQVPADWMGRQVGVKAVALRELSKKAPEHPLVVSEQCRNTVATVTLINFNQAGRPSEQSYADFAPDDEKSQAIFKAYPK